MKELPPPVAGEVLRLRMIANLGREDELLNAARFDRLLRQAHDAELVEVRKVGEDMYDVAPLGQTNAPPARYERKQQPASRPADEPVSSPEAQSRPGGVEIKPDLSAPRGLGPRRGTRMGMTKAAVPLVGVISLDDEKPKAEKADKADEAAKPAGRGRGRGAKPAEKAVAPAAEAAAAPAKKRSRRGGRGRGKPKAE